MNLKNTPICHVHNIIVDKAFEILRDLPNNEMKLISLCEDIIKLATHAEKQGQSMEDRLRKYKEGIEALGFIRTRKIKGGK